MAGLGWKEVVIVIVVAIVIIGVVKLRNRTSSMRSGDLLDLARFRVMDEPGHLGVIRNKR
jgi:hypothetical protein